MFPLRDRLQYSIIRLIHAVFFVSIAFIIVQYFANLHLAWRIVIIALIAAAQVLLLEFAIGFWRQHVDKLEIAKRISDYQDHRQFMTKQLLRMPHADPRTISYDASGSPNVDFTYDSFVFKVLMRSYAVLKVAATYKLFPARIPDAMIEWQLRKIRRAAQQSVSEIEEWERYMVNLRNRHKDGH